MLELYDPNAHGFVAIPVILACREPRLFELLREPMTPRELASRLGALIIVGHLQVALRLLHSSDSLEPNERGEYCLTKRAHFDELPSDILSLYEWNMSAYLTGMSLPPSSLKGGHLREWICRSQKRQFFPTKFWRLDKFVFIEQIPKTSVGKFDKKVLRQRYAEGALE